VRPVTDSFLNTVRGPHKAVFRARLVDPWATGVNPASAGAPVPVIKGDVTFDVHSDVNATMDLTISAKFEDIDPYAGEIYLERGVMYANGIAEYVGLGYFRINTVEDDTVEDSPSDGPVIRITGEDRMANLRDGRVPSPIQFSSSASVASVIDFLVQDVMPTVVTVYDTVNWPGGTAAATTLGSDHFVDQDRLAFIQELVSAYGKICYFDYAGRFVVKDAPSTSGTPVFNINSGSYGVLVHASRSISRDGVYNAVVASGEAADANVPPVYSVATDSDPASPTYYGGPFGKVPKFFTSSFLTTVEQCANTAQKLLTAQHGLPYQVTLGVVPNPALEAWDVISVTYAAGTVEVHIIDQITYSMSVDDEMSIQTRKQYLN
jgi:Domain of unknown function (DUF5047)